MTVSEPTSRLSASEFVADTLRREILRGDLLPGMPLLQDHIAARFDVSQSSVREALRRLEALALVTFVRNRGTFVSTLNSVQIEEMYDIRLAVELLGLRNHFEKLSSEQLATAASLLASMENDPETALLGDTHKKFHAMFYDSPERKLGKDILQNIYGNLTRVWVDFIRKKPGAARRFEEESGRDHRELLQAARTRNLARAEEILTLHVNRARELLVAHLREADRQPAPSTPATPTPQGKRALKVGRRSSGPRV